MLAADLDIEHGGQDTGDSAQHQHADLVGFAYPVTLVGQEEKQQQVKPGHKEAEVVQRPTGKGVVVLMEPEIDFREEGGKGKQRVDSGRHPEQPGSLSGSFPDGHQQHAQRGDRAEGVSEGGEQGPPEAAGRILRGIFLQQLRQDQERAAENSRIEMAHPAVGDPAPHFQPQEKTDHQENGHQLFIQELGEHVSPPYPAGFCIPKLVVILTHTGRFVDRRKAKNETGQQDRHID